VYHSTLRIESHKQEEIFSFGFRISDFGFRISGFGFRVSGFGNLFDKVQDSGVDDEGAQVIELGERAHQPQLDAYTGHVAIICILVT